MPAASPRDCTCARARALTMRHSGQTAEVAAVMAVTAAYGAVLLVSVKRDRTHEPLARAARTRASTSLTHARLQKVRSCGSYSCKKIAHLEMKSTALVAASDSSNGVSAGPTTGMLLTRLNSEGIKLPNRLRIPKSSTCSRAQSRQNCPAGSESACVSACGPRPRCRAPERRGGQSRGGRGRRQRGRCRSPAPARAAPGTRTPVGARR